MYGQLGLRMLMQGSPVEIRSAAAMTTLLPCYLPAVFPRRLCLSGFHSRMEKYGTRFRSVIISYFFSVRKLRV